MRRVRGFALLAALCGGAALGACAAPAPRGATPPGAPWRSPSLTGHPLVGRVFDARSGDELTPAQAVARLVPARFVLLGEKHDNADHHRLQGWLIAQIAAAGRRPAVVLEMLDEEQRDALVRHLQERPRDAAGLGGAVGWDASGWPAWSLYQPIADAALAGGLPIAPGSLARKTLRSLTTPPRDAATEALWNRLALADAIPDAVRDGIARDIERGHCGAAPASLLPRMVDAQRARDAALAEALVAAGGDGAVLIAGTGHTRADQGVPLPLAARAPAASVASLAFVEVSPELGAPRDATAPSAGVGPHDLVWFTPRADDEDPCAKFAPSLERLSHPR